MEAQILHVGEGHYKYREKTRLVSVELKVYKCDLMEIVWGCMRMCT